MLVLLPASLGFAVTIRFGASADLAFAADFALMARSRS
jgi:hypothetical protein